MGGESHRTRLGRVGPEFVEAAGEAIGVVASHVFMHTVDPPVGTRQARRVDSPGAIEVPLGITLREVISSGKYRLEATSMLLVFNP